MRLLYKLKTVKLKEEKLMGKKLVVKSVNWRGLLSAEGEEVYLEDYDSREEAEQDLFDLVAQHIDYEVEEIDEDDEEVIV
jgi:hypothetical protein